LRYEQASALLRLCRAHGRSLVVNDHVALCMEIDADGVHVGADDAPLGAVRAALGPDKIVGASCYGDFGLAQAAASVGASYVAFGGFYPSRVKQYAVSTPLSIVELGKERLAVPVVVIGGMTVQNARPLVEAGGGYGGGDQWCVCGGGCNGGGARIRSLVLKRALKAVVPAKAGTQVRRMPLRVKLGSLPSQGRRCIN
jgi:thiamine-phosphate diphosphorylase